MKKLFITISAALLLISCISTKSTIKNINDNVEDPELNEYMNCFIISKKATDSKYGFNEDYPINVGFTNVADGNVNQVRFLSGLTGPNGEKLKFKIIETCCPYPTKKTGMGAGTIDIFEVTWVGQKTPIKMYINKYEKGEILIPVGFTQRKIN